MGKQLVLVLLVTSMAVMASTSVFRSADIFRGKSSLATASAKLRLGLFEYRVQPSTEETKAESPGIFAKLKSFFFGSEETETEAETEDEDLRGMEMNRM